MKNKKGVKEMKNLRRWRRDKDYDEEKHLNNTCLVFTNMLTNAHIIVS
jgi:hypothetical protein